MYHSYGHCYRTRYGQKYAVNETLRRVEPLLCNDLEKGGYIRPVSGQRLGKHIPVARQQSINNATVGLQQWKSCVSYIVRAERLQARQS
jgi:hypothetical protein